MGSVTSAHYPEMRFDSRANCNIPFMRVLPLLEIKALQSRIKRKLIIASVDILGEVYVWGRCLVGLVSVVRKSVLPLFGSGGGQKGARFVSWSRRLRLYHQNP